MPILEAPYKPPFLYKNTHIATILPSQFRRVKGIAYTRERILTPDHDFLDIDWNTSGNKRCAILLHGFEGDANRPYVLGMVKHLRDNNWDVAAMNYRGCSGEPNNHLATYHAGKTDDVDLVTRHCINKGYEKVAIIGFSLGGNLVLKYMSEFGGDIKNHIAGGVGVSVPVFLETSAARMQEGQNWIYNNRFIRRMRKKFKAKKDLIEPALFEKLMKLRRIRDIDEEFTAPLFGFADAHDYYSKSSGTHILQALKAPTLIINAQNDSFLAPDAYPIDEAKQNSNFFLMMPKLGGHCGYKQKGWVYFHEQQAVKFFEAYGN